MNKDTKESVQKLLDLITRTRAHMDVDWFCSACDKWVAGQSCPDCCTDVQNSDSNLIDIWETARKADGKIARDIAEIDAVMKAGYSLKAYGKKMRGILSNLDNNPQDNTKIIARHIIQSLAIETKCYEDLLAWQKFGQRLRENLRERLEILKG